MTFYPVGVSLGSMNLPSEDQPIVRKSWRDPQLLVFGTVDTLTLARNKAYGSGDAFTFENESTRLSH